MRNIKPAVIALIGLSALISCKKGDNPATGQASGATGLTEMSTDPQEGDTVVSQVDSITRTNRSDETDIEEQEP
ncbi:hypothetical protein CHU92_03350 [Flavobacterium cyanobacteriorum]|uniref:Uncharacterized protein n=1 Tax=Flavobacterium cyanobacteriorum TaxID=2022802 RepID=A0A255ZPS9_9FLAO|nr:hypothetical protein [Flavobacterium cyanobacteriorum]OYQ43508.1 hypothetical protein CHU92_03350 [Flavobacterium cyanobacteriorum]